MPQCNGPLQEVGRRRKALRGALVPVQEKPPPLKHNTLLPSWEGSAGTPQSDTSIWLSGIVEVVFRETRSTPKSSGRSSASTSTGTPSGTKPNSAGIPGGGTIE